MRRQTCSPDNAFGNLLARSIKRDSWQLTRGQVIGAAQIAQLNKANVAAIEVIQVGIGDLLANAAANRMLHQLHGPDTTVIPAFGARGKLIAGKRGILYYDQAKLGCANLSNSSLRVSATPPLRAVTRAALCATVRVREPVLIAAAVTNYCTLLPCLRIYPFCARAAALVQVGSPDDTTASCDANRQQICAALAATSCSLTQVISTPATSVSLAQALSQACTAALVICQFSDPSPRNYDVLRQILERNGAKPATLRHPHTDCYQLSGKAGNATVLAIAAAAPTSPTTSLLIKIVTTDLPITMTLLERVSAATIS